MIAMHEHHRRMLDAAAQSGVERPELKHNGERLPRIVGVLDGDLITIPVCCSPTRKTNLKAAVALMRRYVRHKQSKKKSKE